MTSERIDVGVLHPGAMGASVAAAVRRSTADGAARVVLWCSDGRSDATRERADAAGCLEADDLADLVERCGTIVSVCPPGEALAVADGVAALGFAGLYVDANAVSPATARAIADRFEHVVDGGIIGPPAHTAGTTRLYLSGERAAEAAALWADSPLEARVVDGPVGAASALKMAYATWTKASSAMLLAVRALARAEGVEEALLAEWEISQPGTDRRSEATARATAPKAWRFDGEMVEIAETFESAGLPPGFGDAAREVYARLAGFRGRTGDEPDATLDDVLSALLASD